MKAPETVIVKYNAGNVRSVLYALERLGVRAAVSDDPGEITAAERVIFPGVGEASSAMAYLRQRGLDGVIAGLRQPVLGICLGMQLMCRSSEEGGGERGEGATEWGITTERVKTTKQGETDCLGILPVRVRKFVSDTLKIPQVGWNDIHDLRSPLFEGVDEGSFVYFVHGYYVERGEGTVATADYTLPYSAALQKDNFHAVQFHPERSGAVGRRILENFIFNL